MRRFEWCYRHISIATLSRRTVDGDDALLLFERKEKKILNLFRRRVQLDNAMRARYGDILERFVSLKSIKITLSISDRTIFSFCRFWFAKRAPARERVDILAVESKKSHLCKKLWGIEWCDCEVEQTTRSTR